MPPPPRQSEWGFTPSFFSRRTAHSLAVRYSISNKPRFFDPSKVFIASYNRERSTNHG